MKPSSFHNKNKRTSSGKDKKKTFNPFIIYLLVAIFLGSLLFVPKSKEKVISWNEFAEMLKEGNFSAIKVNRSDFTAVGEVTPNKITEIFNRDELKNFDRFNFNNPFSSNSAESPYKVKTEIPSVDSFNEFIEKNGIDTTIRYASKSSIWTMLLLNVLPFVILIFLWIWLIRGSFSRAGKGTGGPGGIFNVGKSRAKLYDRTKVNVTFQNVAGLHEAKQEVEEIVEFLKNPSKFTLLGGKIPKGALLVGPPGTGKTLLAKAVAGEAHVPFFSMSGSDFVEMFVGVGASRVRDLFEKAKEKAPCIVFIDEIDAVGRSRGRNNNLGGNDERENTLNQLLTEMDGFDSNSGVIVMGATNRVDVLDSALLRAGRFDRQIHVDLPDINDRIEIFQVHMKGLKLAQDINLETLSRQTPGFSGADIANVCNEAALIAARKNKKEIQKQDFSDAIDRIVGGLEKKNRITTEEERRSIAIHEAGHATVSWHIEYGDPLVKVTIVPRGKALGAAWYMPEERQITHTQVLLDNICSLLGGRAAEDLFLGRISTGAANDLERVNRLANAIVTYYGMSDKLPNAHYHDSGQDYTFQKPYSEKIAEQIDQEVQAIIAEQYRRAKEVLRTYAEGHHKLAQLLLDREVIYTEDVENIFGKRPWKSRSEDLLGIRKQNDKKNNEGEKENDSDGSQLISISTEDKQVEKKSLEEKDEEGTKSLPEKKEEESALNNSASDLPHPPPLPINE